jgi:prolipoprotein diacylglyceryltransferase
MTLNMGQWLSVPFILAGVAFMLWAWFRHKEQPLAVATPAHPKQPKNKRHYKK